MTALRTAVLLAALAAAPIAAQTPAAPAAPAAPAFAPRPGDVGSVDSIVAAVYDVISGPAGPRDWNRFRSLFAPGARIVFSATRQDGTSVQRAATPEDYMNTNGPTFMRIDFRERELARRTERFGSVVHVWSTFAYDTSDPARVPSEVGINSIQLVFAEGRWWVVNLLTAAERPWNPLPAEYKPAAP